MKIAVVSDQHLGFALGSEREEDSFSQAMQAFSLAVEMKADFILLPGDFFDESVPKQEVWYRAFSAFAIPMKAEKSKVVVSREGNEFKFVGMPVIGIHGTHEFRPKDYKNPFHVLENAGFLLHLHGKDAVVEKGGEKARVFGMGGVPEKKALDVLKRLAPKPEKGAFNIFVMHQSIREFLPFDDDMVSTVSLADLPSGFDLVVNGHLHWFCEKDLGGTVFLMPGSTIATQAKSLEAEKPKGFVMYDTLERKGIFVPIPRQRTVFYEKLAFKDASPQQIAEKVSLAIDGFLGRNTSSLKPVIRIKCTGSLAKGFMPSDVSFSEIENNYSPLAILSIGRDFGVSSFRRTIEELREMQAQKKTLSAMGLEILERKLLETGFGGAFDAQRVFVLLSEGSIEQAEKAVRESLRS